MKILPQAQICKPNKQFLDNVTLCYIVSRKANNLNLLN
jgi:hypothetical protein